MKNKEKDRIGKQETCVNSVSPMSSLFTLFMEMSITVVRVTFLNYTTHMGKKIR